MGLVYKQLFKQTLKDRIFISLLFLLTVLTSLSFFFVMFSIDGNMANLNAFTELTENQSKYKNALTSNTSLAYTFLFSLIGLTAFVFVMYFYRFFRANKKQIGCIKALGFKNITIELFLVLFTAVLSIAGALLGVLGGYFLSSVLINANTRNYEVTGLIKWVSPLTAAVGLGVSTLIFCLVAYLCYGFVRNKEAGVLLAGSTKKASYPITLKIADKVSKIAPKSKRLSLRIALRKPLSVLLLVTAVMSFIVCVVLGQSLHISSGKVFEAQTEGRSYEYETKYEEYQTAEVPDHAIVYVDTMAMLSVKNYELDRTLTGLYNVNELYELKNKDGELLTVPTADTVYINLEFAEIYSVEIGDVLTATVEGETHTFTVEEIAVNAKSKCVYINGTQLSEILNLANGAYNGVLSNQTLEGGTVVSKADRIDELERSSVSNQISAIINQATGILVGAILIFFALYINFQDNTHDMVILGMMGHSFKEIKKLLVNVYWPILWIAFTLTLAPGIFLAKAIQNSLSISTNDYMPFGVNALVIIIAFALINLIHWGVQATFNLGIKKLIAKKEIEDIVYVE